jgi:hypothetical protein
MVASDESGREGVKGACGGPTGRPLTPSPCSGGRRSGGPHTALQHFEEPPLSRSARSTNLAAAALGLESCSPSRSAVVCLAGDAHAFTSPK